MDVAEVADAARRVLAGVGADGLPPHTRSDAQAVAALVTELLAARARNAVEVINMDRDTSPKSPIPRSPGLYWVRDKRVRTAQWNVALVGAEGVTPFGCIDDVYPIERYEIGPMLHPPMSATSTLDELGDAVDNVEMLRVKLKRGEPLSNDERRRQMRDEEIVLASAPRLLDLARSGAARQAMAEEMGRIRDKVTAYCWGTDRDPGQTDPGTTTEALVSFVIGRARDGDERAEVAAEGEVLG